MNQRDNIEVITELTQEPLSVPWNFSKQVDKIREERIEALMRENNTSDAQESKIKKDGETITGNATNRDQMGAARPSDISIPPSQIPE